DARPCARQGEQVRGRLFLAGQVIGARDGLLPLARIVIGGGVGVAPAPERGIVGVVHVQERVHLTGAQRTCAHTRLGDDADLDGVEVGRALVFAAGGAPSCRPSASAAPCAAGRRAR